MCVKFEGRLAKAGRYWPVEVPALDLATQGRSRSDALRMIREAITLLVDRPGFDVEILSIAERRFILKGKGAEDDKYLIAFLLKQQRAKYGLTIAEVARRLGITKHAYAQYEQARSLPSLPKIEEFVRAMSSRAHVVVGVTEEIRAA
jgi:DNA-binding XRE family transcriptional regulator/predicted RNase H-like HicB family nuclease